MSEGDSIVVKSGSRDFRSELDLPEPLIVLALIEVRLQL
jgi:hypothetical protein